MKYRIIKETRGGNSIHYVVQYKGNHWWSRWHDCCKDGRTIYACDNSPIWVSSRAQYNTYAEAERKLELCTRSINTSYVSEVEVIKEVNTCNI